MRRDPLLERLCGMVTFREKSKKFEPFFLTIPLPCGSPYSTGVFSHHSTPWIGLVTEVFASFNCKKLQKFALWTVRNGPMDLLEGERSGMVRKNTPKWGVEWWEKTPRWLGFGVFNSGSGIVRKYEGLAVESWEKSVESWERKRGLPVESWEKFLWSEVADPGVIRSRT